MGSIVGAGEPVGGGEDLILSIGDKVEVGISSLYRSKGAEMWLKVSVVTEVRHDEAPEQTYDRGFAYCSAALAETVEELENA